MTHDFDPRIDKPGLPSLGTATAILLDRDPLALQNPAWLHLTADRFEHVHTVGDLGEIILPAERDAVFAPLMAAACGGVLSTSSQYAAHIAIHVGGPTQRSINTVLEKETAFLFAYWNRLSRG
ncbi:hypothetical protein [Microcella sp.]|uniref:hypothetical protein n=1 Tax=Microcella sp. TaxID=1913979 RepID=UPI00391A040A